MSKDDSVREKMFASIASWQTGDLFQKEWCRQQGVIYHIFHYWYRIYREQHSEPAGDSAFVHLKVKPAVDASCEGKGTAFLYIINDWKRAATNCLPAAKDRLPLR
jgi:hypothetical protein